MYHHLESNKDTAVAAAVVVVLITKTVMRWRYRQKVRWERGENLKERGV
jgi:hypothetical protein